MEFVEIIKNLKDNKISVYEAVEKIKENPKKYSGDLRVLLQNPNPYFRLFSAWSLGEIKDKKSFSLLQNRLIIDNDDNVRANIVRALYFINPDEVSLTFIKKIIQDKYFIVQLLGIKFLYLCPKAIKKISFEFYYKQANNDIVKKEYLRSIYLFRFNKHSILNFLENELERSQNILIKIYAIKAIALINDTSSLDVLIKYYYKNKSEFEKKPYFAFAFASAVVSLCQSKAYQILNNLYLNITKIL